MLVKRHRHRFVMEPKQPRICVSICERTVDDIRLAAMRAAESADLIELRLDYLDQSLGVESLREIKALFPVMPVPVIVTYRPSEQGGRRDLSAKQRLLFWLFNRPAADLFDVEFDIASAPSVFDSDKHFDWDRVISSYHNFRGVPDDLVAIYERMSNTRAHILKFALHADDAIDCLPVFHLLERGIKSGHEMIAIAMGTPGLATRILGPSRGAFLTYASPDNEKTTAPGQISARELREVYRIERVNRQTQIMGLVGLPVAHSVSPAMHNAAFEAAGVDGVYVPFEVKDLKGFIDRMVHPRTRELDWNMRGLSVTAPHKSAVMSQLDWTDPVAQEIGAVNTIVVNGETLRGYNTDSAGFIAPLLERCGDLKGASCAVIGTGGAARTAVWSLRRRHAEVTVFARNAGTAKGLAERFAAAWEPLEGATFKSFNIVVNATPLGTAGPLESVTPATASQLAGASFAYDLVYNPTRTRFLREAEGVGCETLGGLEMLVAQAEEQFRLWTGVSAPECVMRDAANRALSSSSSEYQL
ncbi:MAG: shikimate dehydrogenase [Pyrinomonadaceae bacterium]|nr:shikimate dehydrogenase [Pyrinomonadaceae bacterium]